MFGSKKWFNVGVKPLEDVAKLAVDDSFTHTNRPAFDSFRRVERRGVQFPLTPVSIRQLYDIAYLSAVVRTCINAIRNEIFRRGLYLEDKFTKKCVDCDLELEEDTDACPDCGGVTIDASKPQFQHWTKFFERINENEQSLEDVLMSCEDDLNVTDDGYLICIKNYHWVEDVLYSRVIEVIRGDPRYIRLVADEGGHIGRIWWTCLEHRTVESKTPGRCAECGHTLFEVTHVMTDGGVTPTYMYVKGEVLHFTKYHKSLLYGISPLITIWKETTTLLNMNEYVNDYYRERQHPKGVVAAVTDNAASVEAAWIRAGDYAKQNPHYVPIIAIESESGRGRMDFVSFADTLKEMEYTTSKDELRDRVSAFYGVSPILMADVSTGGGLNNEGLQIKVTDRAVASAQRLYHRTVFLWLERQLGMTDWSIKLYPSVEEDEMAELERKALELANAKAMKDLGFEPTLDEKGDFKFEKIEEPEPTAAGEEVKPKEGD